MSDDLTTLRGFIERQLIERSMSAREFARFVGVASSTISRSMAFDSKSEPSLAFLDKLANATSTDICYLVNLIYPQKRGMVSPDVARLAEQISHLPVPAQELMDSIILGLSMKNNGKDPNIG